MKRGRQRARTRRRERGGEEQVYPEKEHNSNHLTPPSSFLLFHRSSTQLHSFTGKILITVTFTFPMWPCVRITQLKVTPVRGRERRESTHGYSHVTLVKGRERERECREWREYKIHTDHFYSLSICTSDTESKLTRKVNLMTTGTARGEGERVNSERTRRIRERSHFILFYTFYFVTLR